MTNAEIKRVEKRISARMFFRDGWWTYRFNDGQEAYVYGFKNSNPAKLLRISKETYIKAFEENMI